MKVTISENKHIVNQVNSIIEDNRRQNKIVVIDATGDFINRDNRLVDSKLHIVLNDAPLRQLDDVNYVDLSQLKDKPDEFYIFIADLINDYKPNLIVLRDKLISAINVKRVLEQTKAQVIHICTPAASEG